MWEMIERMATDRLWIYTGIAGSIFGAAFLAYFQGTRLGLWFYAKFAAVMDYFVVRWNIQWFKHPENAWRKKYPHVTKKIDELEARISQLEGKND